MSTIITQLLVVWYAYLKGYYVGEKGRAFLYLDVMLVILGAVSTVE